MRLPMDGSRGGGCVTGPRDMKPWEVRLYTVYRQNLHNIKPTTKQGRNIHRLERALIVWPAWAFAYLKGRRRAASNEAPKGAFFIPKSNSGGDAGNDQMRL